MFDERAFIKQFEAADAKEMARTLARPTSEQETALRLYLGDRRYKRMHSKALQAIAARRRQKIVRAWNILSQFFPAG